MNPFITDDETVEAEEWDLMDYINEDDNDDAKRCKETSIKSLMIAIKASGGGEKKSKSLLKKCARNLRTFKCLMAFFTFKFKQVDIEADDRITKPYAGNELEWNQEYSVDISHIAQTELNQDEVMTLEGMHNLFGEFGTTIQGRHPGSD